MATQAVTPVTCPQCRTPFTAPIQQIVDAQRDSEAKARLLSGQFNTVICPQCGFQGALSAPFLYHDSELEIAFVYLPMDLGVTDLERQKAIGDLTNRLMNQLPPEARKGYLLQPRTFFSVQNLVDAILEQDDETREAVETQRRKMELLDQLRRLDPEDNLAVAQFIGEHDQELDDSFFQLLDFVIRIAEAQGDTSGHDRLAQHRATMLEKSTVGRSFKAQEAAVEALLDNPTRETLLDQLVAAEERGAREALVVVGRQLLDYAFFQALTARIDAAEAGGDRVNREALVALRKEVQEIRDDVDAMTMAVLEDRAQLLQDLLRAEDPRELALRRVSEIDQTFFTVLSMNIHQADSEGRQDVVGHLRQIGDVVVTLLNELAPPEIRLVNQLAAAESDEEVEQLLEQEREQLNGDFLELVNRAVQDLQRGKREKGAERLRYAAERIGELIG
jgi:hypothetical protein